MGLAALYASFFLPVFIFATQRYPPKFWFHPQVAPTAVLSIVIVLYMLDNTLNAMFNPVFTLICGGITGLVVTVPKKRASFKKLSRRSKKFLPKISRNVSS